MKIRVLIADDHKAFRSALRCLLEMDPAIDVIGEASNGQEACQMATEQLAQVVCMDFRMARMDGAEATRRLITAIPHIKIIGLSASFDDSTESEMLAAGASVYVSKAHVVEDLLPAIHALVSLNDLVKASLPRFAGDAIQPAALGPADHA
jgi:DNA-binding NarL/FixJ family response regulator